MDGSEAGIFPCTKASVDPGWSPLQALNTQCPLGGSVVCQCIQGDLNDARLNVFFL